MAAPGGDVERRITRLESDMDTLKGTVVKLETTQVHISGEVGEIRHAIFDDDGMKDQLGDVRNGQKHIIRKIDTYTNARDHGVEDNSAVTFKWIVEKLVLPIILPVLTGGGAVLLAIRLIQQGALAP